MAKKIDDELLDDLRQENKNYHKNGGNHNTSVNSEKKLDPPPPPQSPPPLGEEKYKEENKNTSSATDPNINNETPPKDEFQEKFDEFFKNNPLIAGTTAVNLVDDLKTNFFMVYAKKNGVDMPKEAFAMDAKTKEFTAFLVDHAIKGKMFEWIKKYPLVAALGVFGLSAGTTFLMIKMLAAEKNDKEEMAAKIKDLEKKLWEERKAKAETVDPITEEKEESVTQEVKNIIAQM